MTHFLELPQHSLKDTEENYEEPGLGKPGSGQD
jgi:hypothetical protein